MAAVIHQSGSLAEGNHEFLVLDNNENKRDRETRIFTWKPLREKTTDARRRNHYDGGVLQARDDRPS